MESIITNKERLELAKELIKNSESNYKRWVKTGKREAKSQACEKAWGAYTQTLKSIKPNLKSHNDFEKASDELSKRYPSVRAYYSCASGLLHSKCFYDGYGEPKSTHVCIKAVKQFVNNVDKGNI